MLSTKKLLTYVIFSGEYFLQLSLMQVVIPTEGEHVWKPLKKFSQLSRDSGSLISANNVRSCSGLSCRSKKSLRNSSVTIIRLKGFFFVGGCSSIDITSSLYAGGW